MAVTYGFYNALQHDRLYDAIQMSSIFDGIIRDGIFSTIGTSMVVTAPEDGLYVNVGPGRAWFNHTWTLNDTEYPVEAEEAEVVLDRIDAVILEVNSAAEVRANSIKFLKGTPASEPVKPTLTHNAEVNQYALAYVRIRAGQSTIFQADVENAVGTEETPFVTGLMQQVSIENLILQWEAEFDDHFENWRNINEAEFEVWSSDMQDEYNRWILNQVNTYQTWFAGIQAEAGDDIDEVMAWFEHMKGQVSEDAAIRLQEEIDELALTAEKGSVVTVHTINQTLYGKNCVISQDGQSRTARFDNTGTAVFESIPYVGQVTVTATDGTLTAVTYLTIPYFGRYTTNLAFWAATVNISTESPEFFSLPIKVYKNNALIETISFSALGSATYIATSEGVYKFSVTYDNADFDHTIEIDEETTYTVIINDWNATLNMQTSVSELYGRSITISKGGVTVGTTTFNGSGRATYKVHEPGTYHIVTSTAGGDTYSADVVVTEETAYSVDLGLPNGSTVLPTDDIQTWLHCAGINDKGYTTLSEVLEDSVTFNALLGDSNACDYMARSTTFGLANLQFYTDVDITTNTLAMSLLGRYDYACEAVLANEDWAGAIANSEYWESVLKPLVPTMTSNTTPSGTVSGSTLLNASFDYYKSVNGANETCVLNPSANPKYWQYEFDQPVRVNAFKTQELNNTSSVATNALFKSGTIKGSTDGTTWDTLCTMSHTVSAGVVIKYNFASNKAYKYLKLDDLVCDSTYYLQIGKLLQFYGRHSSQNTSVIHSVPNDTVYYLENGVETTLCTCDSNGVGEVDWSELPQGVMTLYSTTAKDPNNLSNDFSMNIRVTPNKVDAFLIPDGALYWYGFDIGVFGGVANAGYTYGGWTYYNATYNTNNINCDQGSVKGTMKGIGSYNLIPKNKDIIIIADGCQSMYWDRDDRKNNTYREGQGAISNGKTIITAHTTKDCYYTICSTGGDPGGNYVTANGTIYAIYYDE